MKAILADVRRACTERFERPLCNGDIVLDIGGNDGTFLSLFEDEGIERINIDAAKNVEQVMTNENYTYSNNLFSKDCYRNITDKKPRLITTIAMFYHLSDPVTFSQDVASIMDESTIWCIQMSYAGSMMQNCVVDNIVHEHITYYTLKSLSYLASICGLEVFDAEIIEVYGGSIRAFLRKKNHLTSSTKTDNLKKSKNTRQRIRSTNSQHYIILIYLQQHSKRIFELLLIILHQKTKKSMDSEQALKVICCCNT